jgi:glycosyltransferase involved in cell wall biosynthesis
MLPGSPSAPASRYRILQFIPFLNKIGFKVNIAYTFPNYYWRPNRKQNKLFYWSQYYLATISRYFSCYSRIISIADKYDIIMMNRTLVPEHWIIKLDKLLLHKNSNLIFDFDDAIFINKNNSIKIQNIIKNSAWITPGNSYLATFARQFNNNVTVLPTVVDTMKYLPVKMRLGGPLRIGWSGSSETRKIYLPLLKQIMIELSKLSNFEFIVISDERPEYWPGVKTRFIRWDEKTEAISHQLIDIGVMPLKNTPFEQGKCGAKLIIYGALGIPSVASPIGVNSEIISSGNNGFLAKTDKEWLLTLLNLINNNDLRKTLGINARKNIVKKYSINKVIPELINIFDKVKSNNKKKIQCVA